MSLEICGIIHNVGNMPQHDTSGCILPVGHDGPHLFIAKNGKKIHWETDLGCDCEHCRQANGDYCTTYWEA